MSAISPDAAEVQIQLGKLLFTDGRYLEAFNAFEQAKPHEDPRIRREALIGGVKSALRLGDFSHAYADAQMLAKTSAKDSESIALYADALWAAGLFEQSEQKYQDALAIEAEQRSGPARAGPQPRCSQQAERGARDRAGRAQQGSSRRGIPSHGRDRSTSACAATRKRPTPIRATSICSPTRIAAPKAAWARAEVRFLRAFGARPPLQIDPGFEPASCTPSRSASSTRKSSSRRK